MKLLRTFLTGVLLCALAAHPVLADDKLLLGFSSEGVARQRALEARFDLSLKRENLREWMKRMAARPHQVGSPFGKENAEFIAGLFRSWGYETEIEIFQILFPSPKQRLLEMVGPQQFTARLEEPELKEDSTSRSTTW